MKFFKCAVGLTMLLCLKANAWDFEFGYRNVFSPGAMTYVVEQRNMTRTSEGNITYWNPAANGQEARLTQKFVFAQPTVDAFLNINYIYIANFGGGTYGSGELLGSKDGTNWIQLVNAPRPSIIAAGYGWSTNLPAALLGSRELWIQARMFSQGWNIMAQFLRYDSAGRTDNAFDLKVNFTSIALPTLTLQPQSVTADAGSFTNLSLTATGSDALRYQWLKDGVILPGATNATLLFSNLQPVNVGDYVAVVSNGGGSVTSSVASVSIPGVNSGLWQGLVAYYPFNGNANDESENGNNGTVYGAAPSPGKLGGADSCYAFSSTNTWIKLPVGPTALSADYSLSIWAQVAEFDGGTSGWLTLLAGNEGNINLQVVGDTGGDWSRRVGFYMFQANPFTQVPWEGIVSDRAITIAKWEQVTITRAAHTFRFYINGLLSGERMDASAINLTGSYIEVGNMFRDFRTSSFHGLIDDVRIYNRALSSNEVAQLYALEAPVPPSITLQPQSLVAASGSVTNLIVGATGSDALRYQWLKDGVILPGATNATLAFTNLQPVNVGDYVAVVSNGGGSVTSSLASVSIPGVNSGLWQGLVAYYPFNGNANDESGFGNHGHLEGTARFGSDERPAYILDGNSFVEVANSASLNMTTGATYSVWIQFASGISERNSIFGKADPADDGSYMIYNNGNGISGLRPHVKTEVGWRAAETYFQPKVNNWFHFIYTFSSSEGLSAFVDGKQIGLLPYEGSMPTPGEKMIASSSSLFIGTERRDANFPAFHGKLGQLRIYNRALSSNDVAALYQSELPPPTPPAITQNPTDVVATALSPVEFTAAAHSFYPFTYQWQLNGTNLLYATNSTLSILSARQNNVGQYTLIASNAYGSVTSSAANLFLYPYLNAPFTGIVTYWGQTNTLSVGAWGSGSLAYQWYFNGTAIAGATNTTLPLGGIQFTNAGQYSVVVSSSLGSVTNTPYQVVVNPANISLGLFAGVIIQGTVGYSYTIQATTDLSTTNSWATVTNITLTSPIQIWNDNSSDVHSAGNPQKFYQVIPGQ